MCTLGSAEVNGSPSQVAAPKISSLIGVCLLLIAQFVCLSLLVVKMGGVTYLHFTHVYIEYDPIWCV